MVKDKFIDSYAIEIFLGEKRSGKTLSMVALTYEDIKNNPEIMVYSNIWLNPEYFPNVKKLDKKLIVSLFENKTILQDSIFLVDELHLFADSRSFMKKDNQAFSYFVGQIGKRKNIIRGTTHFLNLIDYRLRCYIERKIGITKGIVDKHGRFHELSNYNTILSLEENEQLYIRNQPQIRKFLGVRYGFLDIDMQEFYIKANHYFLYYDTAEIVIVEEIKKDNGNKRKNIKKTE